MSVKVEKIEKNKVKLEFEIDEKKFEEAMKKSFVKNSKNFNIPGFRKGKAPRNMVERFYGESMLYEDAFNFIADEEYDKAIDENDIFAVDRPVIDIKQIGSGKKLIFTAEVTVKPEVQISDYKGIEVKKEEAVVTEDDIQAELEKTREKNARIITIEDRELQDGDVATIDFEGFVDGTPFEGGKGESYDLTIGSHTFIKGFEEQLAGMKIDEEKEVNVTFPEDYFSKELASKAAVFKTKLLGIKAKELPELDDEFAKDISEFDTLDDLKKDIREKLQKSSEEKAKVELENQIIEKLLEKAEVEVPQVMIDRQIDYLVRDFQWRLSMQGSNIESYLQYTNSDMTKMREMFSEKAKKTVETQLILEEISKKEEIKAEQADIDAHIEKLAKAYSEDVETFKKHLKDDDIKYMTGEVEIEKTIDLLIESAKIV